MGAAIYQNEAIIKEMFEKYDVNKDGHIDRKELKTVFNDIAADCKVPQEQLGDFNKKFDEADINKDGKLTFEEFKTLGSELLQKMTIA